MIMKKLKAKFINFLSKKLAEKLQEIGITFGLTQEELTKRLKFSSEFRALAVHLLSLPINEARQKAAQILVDPKLVPENYVELKND